MRTIRAQRDFVSNCRPSLAANTSLAGLLRARAKRAAPVGGMAKRGLDVTLAVLGLLLLAPLILALVIVLKLTDSGPLLYGHRRVGFGGREFRCWKFRTMVVNGDAVLEQYLRKHPAKAALWYEQRKLVDDPRVTPLGAVLRKLSLDELPQLLNVLTGEMSLVGPRPVVRAELDHYASSTRHYLAARPGLSGLWQISGRSNTTYMERVQMDRFYVMKWNPWMDLRIIFMTIPAVALSRGAH